MCAPLAKKLKGNKLDVNGRHDALYKYHKRSMETVCETTGRTEAKSVTCRAVKAPVTPGQADAGLQDFFALQLVSNSEDKSSGHDGHPLLALRAALSTLTPWNKVG